MAAIAQTVAGDDKHLAKIRTDVVGSLLRPEALKERAHQLRRRRDHAPTSCRDRG